MNTSRQLINNPFSSIWKNRDLIIQFAKRDILTRYKGSNLGMIWSFLQPLLMLVVYTFVFSVVFKSKWGETGTSKTEFALILFCGMAAYNIFAEVISRSPNLIKDNANYVKKVIFPLEIMPIYVVISAVFNALISFIILVLGLIIFMDVFHWTIIFLPLVLLPLVLLTIGLSWIFSSLGVYLRDINYLIGILVSALMFLSPIFYSLNSVPEDFRQFFYFNPISYVVEDLRGIFVYGAYPNWTWLLSGTIMGFIIMFIGYYWFMKTKKGFSDVL
ncbi:ABC transporter permease [Paenibacillus sp. y28]|uniref:ABC transporter permease n=1 Tax=Paenibacillus sp. y28 TaxID=3129110 RepID=UPI00301970E6